MTVWALLVAVLLLGANAFFVAAEFALIGSRREVLEPLAGEGNRRAGRALRAVSDLTRQLAASQLGITMASLGLGFVAEPALASVIESAIEVFGEIPSGLLHTISFIVALTLVSFFHMVLGEMVPKNIALAGPERVAMWLAPPLLGFTKIFGPVVVSLNWVANSLVRLAGIEPVDELSTAQTAEELARLLDTSKGEGLIGDFEHGLLSRALHLGGRTIASVVVPMDAVVTVPRNLPVAEIETVSVECGHSRLPLVDDAGAIVGYVHAKDLLHMEDFIRSTAVPSRRIHRMPVLGDDRTLEEALVVMRRTRSHMAVVRGAGGSPIGIVTLEDLVEELVGDIRDESDHPEDQQPRPAPS